MNLQQSTDSELIRQFTTFRDQSAYEELVRRHAGMVYRVCRRLTGNAHDAEDAAQSTFSKLAERAGDLIRHRTIAGWLYSTAWHIATRQRRTLARSRRRELAVAATRAVEHYDDLHATRTGDFYYELYRALEMLPPDYRTAIVLHHFEGMTIAQIADLHEEPIGTIAARVSRGRALLRERLAERDHMLSSILLVKALDADASDAQDRLALEVPYFSKSTISVLPASAPTISMVRAAHVSLANGATLMPLAPLAAPGLMSNVFRVAGAVLSGWPARSAIAVLVLSSVAATAPASRRAAASALDWTLQCLTIERTSSVANATAPKKPKESKKREEPFDFDLSLAELSPSYLSSHQHSHSPEPTSFALVFTAAAFATLRRRPRHTR